MNYRIVTGLYLLASLVYAQVSGQQRQNNENQTGAEVGPLVEVNWLHEQIKSGGADSPKIRIIDLAHRRKSYNKRHIPGAVFVDWRSEIIDAENGRTLTTYPRKQIFKNCFASSVSKPKT